MAVHPVENETAAPAPLLSLEELRAQLQATGEERYHHKHPFHLLMHDGKLTRGQLQAWALNRYYYQSIIPIKEDEGNQFLNKSIIIRSMVSLVEDFHILSTIT